MGIARLDDLGRTPLQLGQVQASTVLHHHLEAARLAQPTNRRWDGDEDEGFLDVAQLAVEAGDDLVLAQGGTPFLPVLVDDEGRRIVRDGREVQDGEAPDWDPGAHGARLLWDHE